MSLKSEALRLARAGFEVFPLHHIKPNGRCSCGEAECSPGKHPLTKNGVKDATTDPEQIERWWTKHPNANIGGRIGLTRLVVDIDDGPRTTSTGKKIVKHGKASLADLEKRFGKLPPTLSQTTGSGSRHLFFATPADARSAGLLGDNKDIDIQRGNKYVVLPPSNHISGRNYRWNDIDPNDLTFELDVLAPAPQWVLNGGRDASAPAQDDAENDDGNNRRLEDLSDDDLMAFADALPNEDLAYDDWVKVGMAFHHQTKGSPEGLDAWIRWSEKSDKFNPDDNHQDSCVQTWKRMHRQQEGKKRTVVTLRSFYNEAREHGWEPTPVELADDEFLKLEDGPDDHSDDEEGDTPDEKPKSLLPKHIVEINESHAIVMNGGEVIVLRESELQDGTPTTHFSSEAAMARWYRPQKVRVGKKLMSKWEHWLEHPWRRNYIGVEMNPGKAPGGKNGGWYNLWRGFAVKPDPDSSCDLFLDHIKTIICRGNADHYQWVIQWMAHLIQKPGEKPGTAIAVRGEMGVGKSLVSDYLRRMTMPQSIKVSSPKHLVGNFNAHLARIVFIQAEESFWAGDRNAEHTLRDLITGETLTIEPKGVDPFEVRSFHRLWTTTNEDWAVPAGLGERRWAVFDASTERKGDADYFTAIVRQMDEQGGLGALMHFLLTLDISKFNVRSIPQTEALLEQKLASMDPIHKWWFERLQTGDLWGDHPARTKEMSADDLMDLYVFWTKEHNIRYISDRRVLFKHMRKFGSLKVRSRSSENSQHQYFEKLPALKNARTIFDGITRQEYRWDDFDSDELTDDMSI